VFVFTQGFNRGNELEKTSPTSITWSPQIQSCWSKLFQKVAWSYGLKPLEIYCFLAVIEYNQPLVSLLHCCYPKGGDTCKKTFFCNNFRTNNVWLLRVT